ncbi:hypothetical protein [Bradyrhizobium sp. dw_78]|uniref:hypothetical protein n=1 Tax=Bradyrhizobium sp. dw_78 TaxID=2719793 RepID=UPI001BD3777E|nr:hypothetical protein [Bradyrhizobium sp. dw_78]
MLEDGEYAAWFKNPRGEGTGIVFLANGVITGGDSVLTYSGSYKVDQDCFTAVLFTKRHTAGHVSLFGIDEIELKLTGKSTGTTASCSGIARQAPELPFQATLIRVQAPPLVSSAGKPRLAGSTAAPRKPFVLRSASK